MNALLDIFGFLSVVLHGLDLVAQSVLLGSVSFLLFVVVPIGDATTDLLANTLRVVRMAALAVVACAIAAAAVNGVVLAVSLETSWRDVIQAHFVIAGGVKALAAAAIGLIVSGRPTIAFPTRIAIVILGVVVLYEALATSHAVARMRNVDLLLLATGAHDLGAAVWLGGLPCFWLALRHAETQELASWIGKRFSTVAATGVALIVIGALAFAFLYIGSIDAVYGTAYGMMSVTKAVLFAILVALGFANFRAVRRFATDRAAVQQVRRFVEAEMGIGFAVLMAAASITSLPPAVDLVEDRVAFADIAGRFAPTIPRLQSPDHATLAIPALQARLDDESRGAQASAWPRAFVPGSGELPPRNAADVAWSEYNHHWAGLLVAIMGLAALGQRSGRAPWAKHWPLLFILLAIFLFLRADPEVWPMGEVGLVESLKDPEVVQHRIFVVLIVAFALFEWRVRTGRIASTRMMRVFPLLTAIGGTLLLTHSHALGNVKEELLVETTHLPIAVLGIAAGWGRWLEVKGDREQARWAGWVWPICFVLIGLLLLAYHEA